MVATELRGLDLLAGATRPEVDAFAAMLDRTEFATGDVIFTEGEVGRTFVILLDGEVVASRASQSRPDHRIELGTGGRGRDLRRARHRHRRAAPGDRSPRRPT